MTRAALSVTKEFEQFWSAYPRHQAKQDALKAWSQVKPTPALVADILSALARQRLQASWRRGYVPLPASWLRGHRWEDDLEPTVQRPFTAAELQEAHRVRAAWGRCEHEPACDNVHACIGRLIRSWREKME
jgi:hypothetical protein